MGWSLLIWPFIAFCGDVAYVISGDPKSERFVLRGALLVFGFHLVLAGVQAALYAAPDAEHAAWVAANPAERVGVEPWLVWVAHLVGLVVAPVIATLLRNIRRLWAEGAEGAVGADGGAAR